MKKPIKLFVPDYYDFTDKEGHRVKFEKINPSHKEENNNAKYFASIEKVEGYHCYIPEIGEDYQTIATKLFARDREENWELPVRINGCKIYTYNWDDKDFHFRIYWIVISETYMLKLVGVFDPQYSSFYKRHFMTYFQATEIDTDFDFSSSDNPDDLFEFEKVEVSIEELGELIVAEKQKEEKANFLEENLKVSSPNFYIVLTEELNEKETARVESFICNDWNMYYNLFNPENFSNPDSEIEWEDNADNFEYYEKPYSDNSRINVCLDGDKFDLDTVKRLIKNKDLVEQNLLSFFEEYTFGNGGAYADSIHYKYAKIEIERLHNTKYTNQEFLMRNLCLEEIELGEDTGELKFYFKCSWDTEHGIYIMLDAQYNCTVGY